MVHGCSYHIVQKKKKENMCLLLTHTAMLSFSSFTIPTKAMVLSRTGSRRLSVGDKRGGDLI